MSQNNYRSTIILDTRGHEESVEALIEGLKKEVAAVKGTVTAAVNEGNRPFARVTDAKFPGAVYVTLDFKAPTSAPAELIERVRLNKTVYRLFTQKAA